MEAVALSTDLKRLAVFFEVGFIKVWDARSGNHPLDVTMDNHLFTFADDQETIYQSLVFSLDGNSLAGWNSGCIAIWNVKSTHPVTRISCGADRVSNLFAQGGQIGVD